MDRIPEEAKRSFSFPGIALAVLGLWVVFGLVSTSLRPLFPVDETRYMTVAWEMHLRGDYILPTLNFFPYHHKPPMMFWLVNLCWNILGVSRLAAAVAPILFAAIVLLLTGKFARQFWPDDSARDRTASTSVLLMAGSLSFLTYASLMMFDHMLTVFVLLALMALWAHYRTARWIFVFLFGCAAGLGILTKGPVMLLYLAFPVFLAPWWGKDWALRGYGWGRWYAAFLGLGLAIAAVIGLSWALPAAMRGGPEYRDMILWGQTAGRMVQAFDHNRPVWWYLPFLPLFLIPWIFYPAVFRRILSFCATCSNKVPAPTQSSCSRFLPRDAAGRFLFCWTLPVLIAFSFISGKQVHYLIPLTPALWIFVAYQVTRPEFSPPSLRKLFAVVVGMMSLLLAGQAIGALTFFRQFDLTPVADVLEREGGGRPIAWVRNYQGEIGFMGHLTEPVEDIEHEALPQWFSDHPDGLAVVRYRRPEQIAPYTILYTTPPEYGRRYAVVQPMHMPADPGFPDSHPLEISPESAGTP